MPLNFLEVSLNCNGYNLELELNKEKKELEFTFDKITTTVEDLILRRLAVMLLLLMYTVMSNYIINLYCSFRPLGIYPNDFFVNQLSIVKNALTSNCHVMGDFNLDARMEGVNSNIYKNTLCNLTNFALERCPYEAPKIAKIA